MLELKAVPSLKSLCIQWYSTFIIRLASLIVLEIQDNPQNIPQRVQQPIRELNETLETYLPWNLYDVVAHEVLRAIDNLIYTDIRNIAYWLRPWLPKKVTKADVAISLAELVISSKLQEADITRWSRGIRLIFYENLSKMVNLKALNFAGYVLEWQTLDRDSKILRGIQSMKNLRAVSIQISCNDEIIKALCETCLHIQFIDVCYSKLVTDLSVEYLLKCRHLEALQVFGTSVTTAEHAKLIKNLPNLKNVGTFDNFELITKCLDMSSSTKIRKLMIRDLTPNAIDGLHLFPNVESLTMCLNDQTTDLTGLNHHMECLKELQLFNASQCMPSSYQFFQTVGPQLTHLHLEFCYQMPLDFLVAIGNCSRLTSLVFCDCEFVENDSLVPYKIQLNPKSFSTLERIIWNVRNSVTMLELVLSKSVNVTCFQVGRSTPIRHNNLENILRANPMKFLKGLVIMYSIDMNMETIQLILDSCPSLKVISGLETWMEITKNEFTAFKAFIKKKNLDLDVATFWMITPGCCEFQSDLFNYS